jgi:hypothetical protein
MMPEQYKMLQRRAVAKKLVSMIALAPLILTAMVNALSGMENYLM